MCTYLNYPFFISRVKVILTESDTYLRNTTQPCNKSLGPSIVIHLVSRDGNTSNVILTQPVLKK